MVMPKDTNNKSKQLEENQAKQVLADKAKPKCSICGKYTDKKTSPQCFGHGGGGGNSHSEKSSGSTSEKSTNDTKKLKNTTSFSTSTAVATTATHEVKGPRLELNKNPFNHEKISELLANKILVIENNKDLGTLTIKLLFDPKKLSPEQRNEFNKFIENIQSELEQFKKENNISSDCILLEKDKNLNILSLRISLPTPALYDAFIKNLLNKNLLPNQSIGQQLNHLNSPNPFSTKPTPSKEKDTHEQQYTPQKNKPSIYPKSPLDGLKPKGYNK